MKILKKYLGYMSVIVCLCTFERVQGMHSAQSSHGRDHSNKASTSADASYEEDLPSEKELKKVEEYVHTRHAKDESVVMVLGAQEHHNHFKDPDMVYLDFALGHENILKYPALRMNFNDSAHLKKLTQALEGKFDLIFTDWGVAQHIGEEYAEGKRISTYEILAYLMRLLNEGGRLRITVTGKGEFEPPTGPQFVFYCRNIKDVLDRNTLEASEYFSKVYTLTRARPDAFPPYRLFGWKGQFYLPPIVEKPGLEVFEEISNADLRTLAQ